MRKGTEEKEIINSYVRISLGREKRNRELKN